MIDGNIWGCRRIGVLASEAALVVSPFESCLPLTGSVHNTLTNSTCQILHVGVVIPW